MARPQPRPDRDRLVAVRDHLGPVTARQGDAREVCRELVEQIRLAFSLAREPECFLEKRPRPAVVLEHRRRDRHPVQRVDRAPDVARGPRKLELLLAEGDRTSVIARQVRESDQSVEHHETRLAGPRPAQGALDPVHALADRADRVPNRPARRDEPGQQLVLSG